MTENEKRAAGMCFDPVDPELYALKIKAHDLNVKYNMTSEADQETRTAILKEMGVKIGEGSYLQGPVYFHYGCNTTIGKRCFGTFNLTIQDDGEVTIGDDCNLGANLTIATPAHPYLPLERRYLINEAGEKIQTIFASPVHIGNDVWFGVNVTVCPGVTIGDACIIGAGSVVTKDIPANSIAAGNPCRVIRTITGKDSMIQKPEILGNYRISD